jgi:glucose-6-phosphate 1-dehydrogenase
MQKENRPDASIFVIFGGAGDLTWRKLVPALYNLFLDHWLPEKFWVLGLDRAKMSSERFVKHLHEGVDGFSRRGQTRKEQWKAFSEHFAYMQADFSQAKTFAAIADKLAQKEDQWGLKANRIFYMAVPPRMIETLSQGLADVKLNRDRRYTRIVVEKPFGHDLDSARALNRSLGKLFDESQIFRIDHYLGKETVQNILAFRFANSIFEPIWNRHYIDHVQITVAENLGVGHRGDYYDHAGALRDMIQNHLLQVLCLIAMEAPISFEDNEVRNKKVDVLHAIRKIPEDRVPEYAVRGQYGEGLMGGEQVPAYRSEADVTEDSCTETFAAVKLFIDNWRWQDVPFYLRTGKRLPAKVSEVSIQFRQVPHQTFPSTVLLDWLSNRLVIAIQPEEGILLRFRAKNPGPGMRLSQVMMQFYYQEAFKTRPPEAYETLLLDVMEGDATLFMRADQAESSWSVIRPILDFWDTSKPADFPNYQAGSWGPEAADILVARGGHSWLMPTMLECDEDTATCQVRTVPHP